MNHFKNMATAYIEETLPKDSSPSRDQLLALRQEMIATLDELFNPAQAKGPDHLSAGQVTLEIIDQDTSLIFRRTLNLAYTENDNGLKLTGENFTGQPTEICFYSQKAFAKINDLTGQGLNQARCEH